MASTLHSFVRDQKSETGRCMDLPILDGFYLDGFYLMDNKYLIDGEQHLVSRFPHVTKVRPTSAADASHHCYLTLVFHDIQ